MAKNVDEVVASVPTNDRWKLDKEIDFEHRDPRGHVIPEHLGRIAESMTAWEGDIADRLGLSEPDRNDIRQSHIGEPNLQRRRALNIWKCRLGRAATYKALIEVFMKAGRLDCAEFVCGLLNDISAKFNGESHVGQSPDCTESPERSDQSRTEIGNSLELRRGRKSKEEVAEEIDMLEEQFSDMQLKLQSELKTNGVSAETLVDSLTLLPIALRAEYQKFVFDNLEMLEKSDSIRKIFLHLNLHFTFVDYGLLGHMVKKFGSTELKLEMSRYSEAVQVFIDETTVQQLLDHWHGKREIPPHFEELRTVIGKDPCSYTLRQVDNLRKKFCSEIKLSETVLVLIGVGKTNSFILRWSVSSVCLTRLKSAIDDLKVLCQSEVILSITLGRQKLYSIAAKYEERLLVLCAEGTGDIAEIQHLLNQPGVDTNIYDKDGNTPLLYASEQGRDDLVQLLLEHGAELDLPKDDEWGNTALMAACTWGHVATAALLIRKEAKIDDVNKKGQHPLYIASAYGETDLVKLLLEQGGVEVDLPNDNEWGDTALIEVCRRGLVTTAALLINKGAKVDYVDKKGHHPLTEASFYGQRDVVILLLDHGAPIDLPNNNHLGFTALGAACQKGQRDVAAILIKRGAIVDYLNKYHTTPLYIASQNGHDHVVQLLLDSGVCVDKPNMDGHFTALGVASQNGHPKVVMTLINKGANVNHQAKDGWTPLLLATWGGHADVVELLIKHGARLDIRDKDGHTPLELALERGHEKVVQILMDASDKPSGDVNIPTEKMKLLETPEKETV